MCNNLPPVTSQMSITSLPSLYASTLLAFCFRTVSNIIGRSGGTGRYNKKRMKNKKKWCAKVRMYTFFSCEIIISVGSIFFVKPFLKKKLNKASKIMAWYSWKKRVDYIFQFKDINLPIFFCVYAEKRIIKTCSNKHVARSIFMGW